MGHECKIQGWAGALQESIDILNKDGVNIMLANELFVPKTKGNNLR